jgi:maltose O-acetyltransferase
VSNRGALVAARKRLRNEAQYGWHYFWFNSVAGSRLMPRDAARLCYHLAGAHISATPGSKMKYYGHARHLTISHGVFMNNNVSIEAQHNVHIGADSSLGPEVMILTSHHPVIDGVWQAESAPLAVHIGNRVWIGARATILPGAHIEDGVVVAAGAVVVGRLKAPGVYGGVPAKLLA